MKIIYRRVTSEKDNSSPLDRYGLRNCYFKYIQSSDVDKNHTKKRHSHTNFEFHIITSGSQSYETEDESFTVEAGHFLMIPPEKQHRLTSVTFPTEKYALTFACDPTEEAPLEGMREANCICAPIPHRVLESIRAIREEREAALPSAPTLIEARTFELTLLLLRAAGITESAKKSAVANPSGVDERVDERVELAKQFIADNVEKPISVGDVASYCYLSEKQLTRLFQLRESTTPASYIRREKIRYIESLLSDSTLTLKNISDIMCFSSEYYFNAFFKKYCGMPPGQYREMTQQ